MEDFKKEYQTSDPAAFAQEDSDKTPVFTRGTGGGNQTQAPGAAFGLTTTTTSLSYATFNTGSTPYISCCKLSDTSILIAYSDTTNSSYGTAILATVSGTVITFGSEYVFNDYTVFDVYCAKITENKALIIYQDMGNGNYSTYVMATIDDSGTIIFSDEVVFSAVASTQYIRCCEISETFTFVTYYSGGVQSRLHLSANSEAIALEDGADGKIIQVIFDGNVQLDGVTKGEEITSDGVTAFCPIDGLLCVKGYWK